MPKRIVIIGDVGSLQFFHTRDEAIQVHLDTFKHQLTTLQNLIEILGGVARAVETQFEDGGTSTPKLARTVMA